MTRRTTRSLTHLTTTNGWVGKFFYDTFGIRIAYTRLGITVALIFIGIPFVVRSVQPVLEKIDLQYEIMPVYEVGMSSWDMEAKWKEMQMLVRRIGNGVEKVSEI